MLRERLTTTAIRTALLLVLIITAGFAGHASAQVTPPTESECWISLADGHPTGTQLRLVLVVDENLDPAVHGIDIYSSITADCSEPVRMTDEPILRGIPGRYEINLVDEDALAPATEYNYRLQVVDSDRNDIDGSVAFDYFRESAEAWFGGDPLIGTGTIVSGPYGWAFEPCESSCSSYIFLEADSPAAVYGNTGVEVVVYGVRYCGIEGCFLAVSSVTPASCGPVPNITRSWSSLKGKYD